MKKTRISSKLKKLVKKRSITLWFWNFEYFHQNLDFGNFSKKLDGHEIDLQRTVFGRSFENGPSHIVIHQRLSSKDENFIWKGRNEWLWWFRSIIRRIFVFQKLYMMIMYHNMTAFASLIGFTTSGNIVQRYLLYQ